MRDYHRFNPDMVAEAVAAARAHERVSDPAVEPINGGGLRGAEEGRVTAKAECIDVPVADQRLNLALPFDFGEVSLPVPGKVKDGSKVRACLDVFLVASEPVGVRLIVSSGRVVLMRRIFDAL